jgi:hypothetical protein
VRGQPLDLPEELQLGHAGAGVLHQAFGIEDIIDPRKTRGYLCRFIDAVQPSLRTELGPKSRTGVRP